MPALKLAIAVLALVGLTASVCGSEPGPTDFEKLEARLESLRKKWKVPGMSAAVVSGEKVVWSHGFGMANMATQQTATPDTIYHLASLTKPFAAVVLLQLVEQGRLNLETPVSQFGISLESPGTIRVRHLLTHTSEGVPGEEFRYSGNRFGQLDKILTGITSNSFAKEVSERILEPLALTNTAPNPLQVESCRGAGRDPGTFTLRLAQGYAPDGVTPVPYRSHFVTAAGLVSTVGDLARFSVALDGEQLLKKETIELAFTPAKSSKGKPLPYGLGWFVQERKGVKLVWHYGWWDGDSSLIVKIPARKLTFILLANSDGLSRKFDLGKDEDVRRSPFARAFLAAFDL